jgi:hypothetical protein
MYVNNLGSTASIDERRRDVDILAQLEVDILI